MLCWFFIVKSAISKVLCQLYVRGILLLAIAIIIGNCSCCCNLSDSRFSNVPFKIQRNEKKNFFLSPYFQFGRFSFRFRSLWPKVGKRLVELWTMRWIKNWTTMGQCQRMEEQRAKSEKGAASSREAKRGKELSNLSRKGKF